MKLGEVKMEFERLINGLTLEQDNIRKNLEELDQEEENLQQQLEQALQTKQHKSNEILAVLKKMKEMYEIAHVTSPSSGTQNNNESYPLDTINDFKTFIKMITSNYLYETALQAELQTADSLVREVQETARTINHTLLQLEMKQQQRLDLHQNIIQANASIVRLVKNVSMVGDESTGQKKGKEAELEHLLDIPPALTPAMNAQSHGKKHALETNEEAQPKPKRRTYGSN